MTEKQRDAYQHKLHAMSPRSSKTHITERPKIKSLNAIQLPPPQAGEFVLRTLDSVAPKKNQLQRDDLERLPAGTDLFFATPVCADRLSAAESAQFVEGVADGTVLFHPDGASRLRIGRRG